MARFLILGNSNNELARLAILLVQNHQYDVTLAYLDGGLLDDPNSLDEFVKYKKNISLLKIPSAGLWKTIPQLKTILIINKIARASDVVIVNSFFPSFVFTPVKTLIFFSTGSDITSYSRYSWIYTSANNFLKRLFIKPFSVLLQIVLVANQRRVIKNAKLIIFPGFGKDQNYDKMATKLFSPQSKTFFIQHSNLKTKLPNPKNQFSRASINVLIGCRLDDGYQDSRKLYTSFNDKGPKDIYKALTLLKHPELFTFIGIRKGKLFSEFSTIVDVNTESKFIFKDILPYNNFIDLMIESDIVIDSVGPAIPARVATDALALGRIVIANTQNYPFNEEFAGHILHASSALQLAEQLNSLEYKEVINHRVKCKHNIDYQIVSTDIAFKSFLIELFDLIN